MTLLKLGPLSHRILTTTHEGAGQPMVKQQRVTPLFQSGTAIEHLDGLSELPEPTANHAHAQQGHALIAALRYGFVAPKSLGHIPFAFQCQAKYEAEFDAIWLNGDGRGEERHCVLAISP